MTHPIYMATAAFGLGAMVYSMLADESHSVRARCILASVGGVLFLFSVWRM
jgi:hypothetical protein